MKAKLFFLILIMTSLCSVNAQAQDVPVVVKLKKGDNYTCPLFYVTVTISKLPSADSVKVYMKSIDYVQPAGFNYVTSLEFFVKNKTLNTPFYAPSAIPDRNPESKFIEITTTGLTYKFNLLQIFIAGSIPQRLSTEAYLYDLKVMLTSTFMVEEELYPFYKIESNTETNLLHTFHDDDLAH
ncbi:hypothetical protein ACE1ET_06375 [Saccharicrinis sp. FJH62]|uniref:hypothetical protein n=1 Tax=Saccharicrinis sp. FJH62 TaxID=3344657 RepID=UPI0035D42C95